MNSVAVGQTPPSAWVVRFAGLVPAGGRVLDLACGAGRHSRFFAQRGRRVDAVDRDPVALEGLDSAVGIQVVCADLETGAWPFDGVSWDGIVVANYLYRPLLPTLIASLNAGGVLIYETFMDGNERFGRPANPAFLLRAGELLDSCRGGLNVLAFEQGVVALPRPAAIQRICAVRGDDPSRVSLPECAAPRC